MSQPGLGINPPSAQPNRVADPTNDVRYVAAASHAQLEDTHANVRNGESPLYDASSEKGVYAVERNEIVYQLVSDACAGMPRVASSLNNIGTAGMTREELKTLIEPMGVAVNHVTEEQIKKGKGKGIAGCVHEPLVVAPTGCQLSAVSCQPGPVRRAECGSARQARGARLPGTRYDRRDGAES